SLAALGEMAAGIAHEIRNPLGSIQLYVQALAEDVRNQPEPAQLCGKIERAVVGLDAIVRDVLSFARNTAIHPRQTNAADLFDRAVRSCETILVGTTLHIEGEPEECRFEADAALLVQVLGNLLRN